MLHERIRVPTSGGEINMDAYVPDTTWKIDPDVRRPAIVVAPGGGHRFCNLAEAEPVALRFLAEGFNVFVVWYRVYDALSPLPEGYGSLDWWEASKSHTFPLPQQDVAACVAHVRAHAEAWHTDPDRIAVMGFSAGAYLAACLGGLWNRAEYWRDMGLAPEDVRPDAVVLSYPVTVADHDGLPIVFERMTGEKDPQKHQEISVLNWVTPDYPPAFLWHTFTDELVKVQNSIRLSRALTDAGVLNELHVFHTGRHGLTLCSDLTGTHQPECEKWPGMAARFLKRAMPVKP